MQTQTFDATSRPFWRALERGRLWIQYCPTCERYIHPPTPTCSRCVGRPTSRDHLLEWREISGNGRVLGAAYVTRDFDPPGGAPYIPVLVELNDTKGLEIWSALAQEYPAEVSYGQEVTPVFGKSSSGLPLLLFELTAGVCS